MVILEVVSQNSPMDFANTTGSFDKDLELVKGHDRIVSSNKGQNSGSCARKTLLLGQLA